MSDRTRRGRGDGTIHQRADIDTNTEGDAMEDQTCKTWVQTGGRSVRGRDCGRPVKDDGLCGTHLAAKRRREKTDAERRAREDAREAGKRTAQALCDRLASVGIEAQPHWHDDYTTRGGTYTGGITIADPEMAAKFVRMLEQRV